MLPYRLRPPIYGGKLKREKKKAVTDATRDPLDWSQPYRQGGPWQRAICHDLDMVRDEFNRCLRAPSASSGRLGDHLSPGASFRIFKVVFRRARVALLHTTLCPPRCDKGATSQLVYASCLSLLKQAFGSYDSTQHNDDQNDVEKTELLQGASFATFCLYALYETNPLPKPHSVHPELEAHIDRQAYLDMFPMGVVSCPDYHNESKLLFRRYFHRPIRIDAEHYDYLIRLEDLARYKQHQCEYLHLSSLIDQPDPNNLTSDDEQDSHMEHTTERDPREAGVSCTCSLASDVISVISRLKANLDYCEYTGPCSLEGLAGHADYPFPCKPPKTRARSVPKSSLTPDADDLTDKEQGSGHSWPTLLGDKLQDYLAKRQVVRMPASFPTMTRSAQSILPQPLNSDSPLSTLWDVVQATGSGSQSTLLPKKRKVVRFQSNIPLIVGHDISVASEGDAQLKKKASGGNPRSTRQREEEDIEAAVFAQELSLPADIPVQLHASIQEAIQTLIDQDCNFFLTIGAEERSNGPSSSVGGYFSSLAASAASEVTEASNVGRASLQSLLSGFMEAQGDHAEIADHLDYVDEIDDFDSETAFTNDGSALEQGRLALKELLQSASTKLKNSDPNQVRKDGEGTRRPRKNARRQGQHKTSDSARKSTWPSYNSKRNTLRKKRDESDLETLDSTSMGSSCAQGKRALDELLQTATAARES